jgi:hypothetical protein
MNTPESVRYDADRDVLSSCRTSTAIRRSIDGNGFIAVVRADSTGVMSKLVEGGKNGAKLDAPKGMAIVGDTLWVADIDAVRGFQPQNRRAGGEHQLEGTEGHVPQ